MTGALLAILGILAVTALGAWFYHFVWPGLMKFRKLRHNIIQEMARARATYARVLPPTTAVFTIADFPAMERAKANAKADYHDLASQLVAFQQNEPIAAWVISRRYDLNKASEGLNKLSQSFGRDDASHEGVVQRALRV